VALRDGSPHLVDAVLAAEDRRFRSHAGVGWRAAVRAALTTAVPGARRSGASTLSQQLVKMVHGRPHGLASKASEVLHAIELERRLGKDEILEQYLNRVPFGDRIAGVERASEEYFGHPASALTVAEAALLAGIPQAPSATEPRRHLARALARRDHVLRRMRAAGTLDDDTLSAALGERPGIRPAAPAPYLAPRFVDAALAEHAAGAIERSAGVLGTSLDLDLQRRAEGVLGAAVGAFERRGATNAAAIVVANASGEVLAYVGAARAGRDVPGACVDLLRRPRQPGSSLKPFAYELLFEKGGTAATVLSDASSSWTGARGALFEPRDYDGREQGPVRARVALASSLNLAALDAASRVGAEALLARLGALGLRTRGGPERFGAAAVLGGLDVEPVELARAYLALARGGTSVPLAFAPVGPQPGREAMRADAAAVVRDVLSDSRARRDAWAAAFSERFTVVVWLGDPQGRPLAGVSGFEAAAPAAARLLGAAEASTSLRATPPPVVLEPRDGARLLLDPARARTLVRLRAGSRGIEVPDARFEVDGVRVAGAWWAATPGEHDVAAVVGGSRSRLARVRVLQGLR
jgi:penicillin-binding protein 1C